MLEAVNNVTSVLAPAVLGIGTFRSAARSTPSCWRSTARRTRGRLGANALLGVSLAVAYAAAAARGEELFIHLNRLWRERLEPGDHDRERIASAPTLPLPMVNMISGGLHAGRNLDIQDVLIIPVGAASYSQALEMSVAMYRAVGGVLAERGLESALVGDEGGYGPKLRDNEHALEIVVDAMVACGLEPGRDVGLALDIASSHFFDPISGIYRLTTAGTQALDSGAMIDLLAGWVERYPILSIEDGLAEDDWAGWTRLTEALGEQGPAHWRRPVRHPVRAAGTGDRGQGRQRDPDQGQPGRDAQRDPRCLAPGPAERLSPRGLGPFRRDRGRHHRRPGRRHRRRPDQDRLGGPLRTAGQVQPVAAD